MRTLIPFLFVRNVEETMNYYERLGFERTTEEAEMSNGLYGMTSGRFELIFRDGKGESIEDAGKGIRFYADVDDVAKKYEKVKDDVEILSKLCEKPYGMTEFTLRDPDGYVFTFAQKTEETKEGII